MKIHKKRSKTYTVWTNMKQRCNNKNNPGYKNYGGRNISICKRWNDFKNFHYDMGTVPENMTLERINNNGNYEKNNCKWASWQEQENNKRNGIYGIKPIGYDWYIKNFINRYNRLIYCIQTKEIFRCAIDLSKIIKVSRERIRQVLNDGTMVKKKNYIYYKNLKVLT